jgi:hypothetical protein
VSKPLFTHLGSALAGGFVFLLCAPEASKWGVPGNEDAAQLSNPLRKSTRHPASDTGSNHSSLSSKVLKTLPEGDSLEELLAITGIRLPTRAELNTYLADNNYPAEGYLAAAMILQDTNLMREAIIREPSNPHILFALASRDDFPDDDRIKWARQLQEVQPDNSLASFLLAALTWENGAQNPALEILSQVDHRKRFQTFTSESIIGLTEALRATGNNPDSSAYYAMLTVDLPHLSQLLSLSQNLQEHAQQSAPEEAFIARRRNASLGTFLAGENDVISGLVGLSIQGNAYEDLPPDVLFPIEGMNPEALSLSIEHRRNQIRDLPIVTDALRTSPELTEGYAMRALALGEIEALRWLGSRTTPPTQ